MKVSVIGLGYVGAVLASGLARAGYRVLGVDVDSERVAAFSAPEGGIPIYEPGLAERLAQGVRARRLSFRNPDDLDEPLGEAAVIATGTPPLESGAVDMSQVRSAIDWIKSRHPKDLTVVMKSTVPPGTGQRIARELAGHGIRYASNPEFLREGRAIADWDSPDRVVIGAEAGDDRAIDVVKRLHDGIDAPIMVTDVTSAEMIKYASNAFLATRISFINEIAALCERVGASIDSVSEGMAMDARTGARIHAGVGYGGSCFPKDVRALDYLALTSGAPTELLRSVISVNNRQQLLPLLALRERFNGALAGLRVAVLGLAFKPQTDDVRGAPSLALIRALLDEGASVAAYDPRANANAARELPPAVRLADSPEDAAQGAQAAALLTEWPQLVDAGWPRIAGVMAEPRFVFDGRNALDAAKMRGLGFAYVGVGRGEVHSSPTESPEQWAVSAETIDMVLEIRKQANESWKNIYKASRNLQGKAHDPFGTSNVERTAKSVVRRIVRKTRLSLQEVERIAFERGKGYWAGA